MPAPAPLHYLTCAPRAQSSQCKCRGADGLPREGHKPYRQAEPWESARRREAGPRPGGGCRRARSQPATPQAPRPARRVAPSEYTSQEGRTARRVQGRRHRAMSRLQPSCPRTLPTVTPTLPVARTRISSSCPPVQYRKGCYHRRGRHSGHGHSGTGLALHAAEGPTLVRSLPGGQGHGGARALRPRPAVPRATQGTPGSL